MTENAPPEWLGVTAAYVVAFAWYCVLPTAAAIALVARTKKGLLLPKHVRRHQWLAWAGIGMSTAAALTSVYLMELSPNGHFASFHECLGLAMLIVPLVTGVQGMLRPPMGSPWRQSWKRTHQALVLLNLFGAVMAIITGLYTAKVTGPELIVGIIGILVIAASLIVMAATRRTEQQKPPIPPPRAGVDSLQSSTGGASQVNPLAALANFVPPARRASRSWNIELGEVARTA
jgi:hypothetical protein